uniref:Uncharacterized protein n=1 Tax=Rhizophora mucronata TaxID=61149 RepID=A0A2P2J0S2_RHIMU
MFLPQMITCTPLPQTATNSCQITQFGRRQPLKNAFQGQVRQIQQRNLLFLHIFLLLEPKVEVVLWHFDWSFT